MKSIQTSSRRAFTLIELLVVIAIIAILAAILFPVFAQAKAAAKKTQSLSNVKNLGTASFLYAGDTDDVFVAQGVPNAANNYGFQMTWIMHTLPYMKNYEILKDPSGNYTPKAGTGPAFNYVANGILAYDGAWKFRGVINASRDWFEQTPRNATSITKPAETILFASRLKMHPESWMKPEIEGAFSPWHTCLIGPDGVDAGKSLPGQKDTQWGPVDPRYEGVLSTIYGGQSTFAFSDGHAKSMKPAQTVNMSATRAGGDVNDRFLKMWDALREDY